MFLKIPIDFNQIIQKKELDTITLEHSIAQRIVLLTTTYFGECKFDETFGCEIWNLDFDFLMSDNILKNTIMNALKESIYMHEQRLIITDVIVDISEQKIQSLDTYRTKKRIDVRIKGNIKETNRDFNFNGFFFVGPLSY